MPASSTIRRIDRSGANFETLITSCVGSSCPTGPQAPSFSSSLAGDLYFVDQSGNVYMIAGAAKTPFGGIFSQPVAVIQNCVTSLYCEESPSGGTAFDTTDNLLFDTYSGKPEDAADFERDWTALAILAERIAGLKHR